MTIALMNADLNAPIALGHDGDQVLSHVASYPTLLFYPAGANKGCKEWKLSVDGVRGGLPSAPRWACGESGAVECSEARNNPHLCGLESRSPLS